MIGLDAILLLVFVPRFLTAFTTRTSPYLWPLEDRLVGFFFVTTVLVGVYIALRLFSSSEGSGWHRTIIVSTLGIFLIGSILGIQIVVRQQVPHFLYIHDGAVQTEDAVAALRSGDNPYAVDYSSRLFGAFPDGFSEATRPNPAWTHYVYPPLQVVLGVPLAALGERLFGWFDIRFLYLLSFIVLMVAGTLLAKDRERRLLVLVLLMFNPFFIQFFIGGFNDVFFLGWIALGALFLDHRRTFVAAVMFGLALASKQLAWFLVPFLLWHLYVTTEERRSLKLVVRQALPMAVAAGLVILPFLVWSARDFLDDVLFFATGSAADSYPVSGFGFGQLLASTGAIRSIWNQFPFWTLQVVVGLPLLLALCRWQRREPTVSRLLAAYGLFALVMVFFSRYFNDSHLGALSVVFILAYAANSQAEHGPA